MSVNRCERLRKKTTTNGDASGYKKEVKVEYDGS
jgi:hypothetical protein